ncbi:MAG: hypothetical protein H6713_15570 [Myxococcales bacterium]|nr:hypothetical protein [Myxococcales bacterium]
MREKLRSPAAATQHTCSKGHQRSPASIGDDRDAARTVIVPAPDGDGLGARTTIWRRPSAEDASLIATLAAADQVELAYRVLTRRLAGFLGDDERTPTRRARLRERCPRLWRDDRVAWLLDGRAARSRRYERAAGEALRWLAQTYTPQLEPPARPQDIARLVARIATVLDVSARGLDTLLRARDRVHEHCAGRAPERRSPPAQQLADVLDWTGASARDPRSFERAFELLARHHTALLAGVIEGARELLASLDPTRARPSRALARGSRPGPAPSRARVLRRWAARRYVLARARALSRLTRDTDRLGAVLLGPRFVTTYRALASPPREATP